MIAIRVLQLLLFAAIASLTLALLRRARVNSRWQITLFCALVVYGFEPAFSIYNILSTAFLLACMGAVLEWQRGGQARWIWLAGIFAGLEIGAKQNVAVLAAVALGVPLLARFEWRALARASAGFTAAVAAVAAGLVSGGGRNSWNTGLPPSASSWRYPSRFPLRWRNSSRNAGNSSWTYQLRLMYSFLALGFAIGCLVLVAAAWFRARDGKRQEMSFVACFAGAAALTLYPISDLSHLAYTIPVLSLAAVIAAARMGIRQRWARAVALLWFVPATVWIALSPLLLAATGNVATMRLPHYWGIPMRTATYDPLVRNVDALRRAVDAGHRPYLVTMHAGFYYLTTGLVNPTPFDYPACSAFGRHGESHLIDALRRHQIP